MDLVMFMYICKDKSLFNILYIYGEFGYIIVGNKDMLKVEGVGRICLKFYNGVFKIFYNVRYILDVSVNLILLGELLYGCRYFELIRFVKCIRVIGWFFRGRKIGKIFVIWIDMLYWELLEVIKRMNEGFNF